MTAPAADAARELARTQAGQFGEQTHADSGEVDVPMTETESVIDMYIAQMYSSHPHTVGGGRDAWGDRFAGYNGGEFRGEVDIMMDAFAANQEDDRYTLELENLSDRDYTQETNMVAVHDHETGLSVVDFTDDESLTADSEAEGEAAARAIIEALIGHRDRLQKKLEDAIAAIKTTATTEA